MSTKLTPPEPGWPDDFGRPLARGLGLSLLRALLGLVPAWMLWDVGARGLDAGGSGYLWLGLACLAAMLAQAGMVYLDRRRGQWLGGLCDGLEARFGARQLRRAVAPLAQDGGGRPTPAMLGRDIDLLRRFCMGSASLCFVDAAFVPIFVLAVFALHWVLGLAALACLAAQLALLLAMARTAALPEQAADCAARLHEFGDAMSRHADCASTMGLASGLGMRWKSLRVALLMQEASVDRRTARLQAAAAVFGMASRFAVFGAGAALAGPHVSGLGAAFAAFWLTGQALAPVAGMTIAWRDALAARAAFLRLQNNNPAVGDARPLPQARGELVLEGVAWTPQGALRPALRGITLKIEAGAVLAIIGPSAAGKSSLARVLCGALRPSQGLARLDGMELGAWSEGQLGAAIGYLPQDVALFPGTIGENIARFGDATEFQIIAAAKLAGVHDMIRQLPDGYKTVLNDRAGLLSAGQRQRVALARALLGDPPVLILDEPDASLDAEGEAALIACMIEARRRRRTVIMITHNTGMVRVADFVATMVGGHVMKVQRTAEVLGRPAMLAKAG